MAFPLILSTAAWSLQQFVDRVFLTWYSPLAVAAAFPAGALNHALASLFIGAAGYVNTFVAQYQGAGRRERIGPVLWQGIYLSAAGGVLLLAFVPAAGPLFRAFGHGPELAAEESVCFRILCYGSFFPIASSALSGFFSGLGENWPVMWVNSLSTGINIVLDYLLIFGRRGLPEMGIAGAAWATVAASAATVAVYAVLAFRRKHNRECHTLRGWRPDRKLFARLLRFGMPAGVQFLLDMAGFTVFPLLMGRLGTEALASTNIALNINTMNIVFASALKGAGDTRFVMFMIVFLSLGTLLLPSVVFLGLLGAGLYAGWVIVTTYVIVLGLCFLLRFLAGKWRSMRVIEGAPPT